MVSQIWAITAIFTRKCTPKVGKTHVWVPPEGSNLAHFGGGGPPPPRGVQFSLFFENFIKFLKKNVRRVKKKSRKSEKTVLGALFFTFFRKFHFFFENLRKFHFRGYEGGIFFDPLKEMKVPLPGVDRWWGGGYPRGCKLRPPPEVPLREEVRNM